jgi:hypothetical protein
MARVVTVSTVKATIRPLRRLKRLENISVCLAPGISRIVSDANPAGGIKASDNAAFGVEPQGYGVANRLAASPAVSAVLAGFPAWPA